MQVRPGGPPRRAEPCNGLTASHDVPHLDEIVRVVRVARHEPIAVIDLDHLAVAGPRTGPRHDAGRDGDDRRPRSPSEVDASMHHRPPRERIDARTEPRRHVCSLHGTAFRGNRGAKVAPPEHLIEYVELSSSVVDLRRQARYGNLPLRGSHVLERRLLRPTDAGLRAEVEFEAIEPCPLDQTLGERLEPHDTRLDATQFGRGAVHPTLGGCPLGGEPAAVAQEAEPPRLEHRLERGGALEPLRLAVPVTEACAGDGRRNDRTRPRKASISRHVGNTSTVSPERSSVPLTRVRTRLARTPGLSRASGLTGLPGLSGLHRLARLTSPSALTLPARGRHVLRAVERAVLIRVGRIELETFHGCRLGAADLTILIRVDFLERR